MSRPKDIYIYIMLITNHETYISEPKAGFIDSNMKITNHDLIR
jgi:hypothetical protein